ncbi:hypothetical protein B0H17DRAFT_1088188, partial [Mycena rosella]
MPPSALANLTALDLPSPVFPQHQRVPNPDANAAADPPERRRRERPAPLSASLDADRAPPCLPHPRYWRGRCPQRLPPPSTTSPHVRAPLGPPIHVHAALCVTGDAHDVRPTLVPRRAPRTNEPRRNRPAAGLRCRPSAGAPVSSAPTPPLGSHSRRVPPCLPRTTSSAGASSSRRPPPHPRPTTNPPRHVRAALGAALTPQQVAGSHCCVVAEIPSNARGATLRTGCARPCASAATHHRFRDKDSPPSEIATQHTRGCGTRSISRECTAADVQLEGALRGKPRCRCFELPRRRPGRADAGRQRDGDVERQRGLESARGASDSYADLGVERLRRGARLERAGAGSKRACGSEFEACPQRTCTPTRSAGGWISGEEKEAIAHGLS